MIRSLLGIGIRRTRSIAGKTPTLRPAVKPTKLPAARMRRIYTQPIIAT